MISAAREVLPAGFLLLALIFGPLTWIYRKEIADFWADVIFGDS